MSEYKETVNSSPSGSKDSRKSNKTGRLEYTSTPSSGDSRTSTGADCSTLIIVENIAFPPSPSSILSVIS